MKNSLSAAALSAALATGCDSGTAIGSRLDGDIDPQECMDSLLEDTITLAEQDAGVRNKDYRDDAEFSSDNVFTDNYILINDKTRTGVANTVMLCVMGNGNGAIDNNTLVEGDMTIQNRDVEVGNSTAELETVEVVGQCDYDASLAPRGGQKAYTLFTDNKCNELNGGAFEYEILDLNANGDEPVYYVNEIDNRR